MAGTKQRDAMRAAYADPPYLGLAAKFYGDLHPDAADYDRLETHVALIERMTNDYDCWAMSLHSPSLREILPHCPEGSRVMAWVKPWTSFKPNIRIAYAWEPVVVHGAPKGNVRNTVRDWYSANAVMKANREFKGTKPESLLWWLFDVLDLSPDDEFHDLFPGSGAVTRAWESWKRRLPFVEERPEVQTGLWDE